MPLDAGSRLGPYEISVLLGQGGMGEVYRALDTAMQRDVAIKILSAALEHDTDRLARFTREAQALGALNHPHIAQVYGLQAIDGPAGSSFLFADLPRSGATAAALPSFVAVFNWFDELRSTMRQ